MTEENTAPTDEPQTDEGPADTGEEEPAAEPHNDDETTDDTEKPAESGNGPERE